MGLSKSTALNADKSIAQTSRRLTIATEELMTGRKSSVKHVVSVLKGLQNESTAKVLEAVVESAKYGSTLLNVASSSLYGALDYLTELRETIAQAETSDANITINLNNFYQSKVGAIIDMLTNANFAGRQLFDGSMTNPASPIVNGGIGGTVPVEGIASTASALSIRVGESFNNNVSINIPRLLSGVGFNVDTTVAGRFTPLFPITQDSINLKNAVVGSFFDVVIATMFSGTDKGYTHVPGNSNAANINTNVQAMKDNQRETTFNDPTTKVGLTDEQKVIVKVAKAAAAQAVTEAGATADLAGANYVRNATLYAVLDAAAPYISADAIAAYRSILDIEKTYPMTNTSKQSDYIAALQNLTLPGNIVGDDIINYTKSLPPYPVSGITDGSSSFDAQKYGTFKYGLIISNAINANPVNALGNLLTRTDRAAADATIVTAMTTVNSVISSLNGQQSIIEGAIDGLTSMVAANKEAANDLLSANIVEAANEVKAILALIQSVYFVLGNIDQINQLNAILLRS